MTDDAITNERIKRADKEFGCYDFHFFILSDSARWEETEPDRLSRRIWGDGLNGAIHAVFHVDFHPESTTPRHVGAYDMKSGGIIGA